MRRIFHPVAGIFLVLLVILLLVGRTRLFRDPGTFWHTVVGEQILATGEFPYLDTFSFSCEGQSWIAYHWLSECVMAAVHRLAGLDALLVATVLALSWLYAWVAARWIQAGFHWSIACVGVGMAIAVSIHNWHVRPHMFSLGMLGMVFAILLDVESGRRTWKALLWMPLIFVLWTNLHGGTLGGLATFGVVVLGWTMLRLAKGGPLTTGLGLATAWMTLLVSMGTTFINPYGREIPEMWFRIMGLELPQIIQEHAPINVREFSGIAIIGLAVVYLLALLGTLPNRPRVTWFIPLVWFALACTRNRHGPLFGIVAVLALADLFPLTLYARRLVAKGSDLFVPPTPEKPCMGWQGWVIPLILTVVAMVGICLPLERSPLVKLDPTYWPVELLDDLKEVEKQPGSKLFNRLNYGGYLIYHVPGLPIFVDDRCELYGNNFLHDYATAERDKPNTLERWALQYRFTHALVETGSPFDDFLAKKSYVEVVKRTPTATLYKRK